MRLFLRVSHLNRFLENIINMSGSQLKLFLAQMNIRWEDKSANRLTCARLVEQAVSEKADVIIFPELTLTGFSVHNKSLAEQAGKSETVNFFCQLAKQNKIAIIFGMIFSAGSKQKNMALAVNAKGKIMAEYQKIHTFSLAKENKNFNSGNKAGIFTLNGFKIALAICYDLRFPGLFEAISTKYKPDVFIVIANWPSVRVAHWRTLLAARSLDTQSYVVGVNRVGSGGGLQYSGFSSVHSPWGEKIIELKGASGGVVTIDKKNIKKIRATFSSLLDKKPAIYSHL